MKSKFTLPEVKTICKELNEKIINKRIQKIYDLEKKEYMLKLEGNIFILIKLGFGIFIIKDPPTERRKIPSSFCQKFRKELTNIKILELEQIYNDRVIEIKMGYRKDEIFRKLIFEIYSDGNLILTNKDDLVMISYRNHDFDKVNSDLDEAPILHASNTNEDDRANPLYECSYTNFVGIMPKGINADLRSNFLGIASLGHQHYRSALGHETPKTNFVGIGAQAPNVASGNSERSEIMSIEIDGHLKFKQEDISSNDDSVDSTMISGEINDTFGSWRNNKISHKKESKEMNVYSNSIRVGKYYPKELLYKKKNKIYMKDKLFNYLNNKNDDDNLFKLLLDKRSPIFHYGPDMIYHLLTKINLNKTSKLNSLKLSIEFMENLLYDISLDDKIIVNKGEVYTHDYLFLKDVCDKIVYKNLSDAIDENIYKTIQKRKTINLEQKLEKKKKYNKNEEIFRITNKKINELKDKLEKLKHRSEFWESQGDYNKANQLFKKKKRTESILSKTELFLKTFENRQHKLKIKKENIVLNKIETNKWYHEFHWFYTTNNFLVIGGKNSKQNELIVKKYLRDDYLYFHSSMPGSGSFVLIRDIIEEDVSLSMEYQKLSNEENKFINYEKNMKNKKNKLKFPDSIDIEEAANEVICHSKGWNTNICYDCYWVYGKQVSKTPNSGEFVVQGSFIIKGEKNKIRWTKLEMGYVLYKDQLMLSPYSRIAKIIPRIKIIPGKMRQKDILSNIKKTFNINEVPNKILKSKSRISNIVLK